MSFACGFLESGGLMMMAPVMSDSKIYIITGGTYAGKTTTVEAIEGRGINTIRESAMEVIGDLAERMGLAGSVKWRRMHPSDFQLMIAERQLLKEDRLRSSSGLTFADRGALDAIAYSRLYGIPVLDELIRVCQRTRYAAAFLLDTLPEFDERIGSGRICTYDESLAVAKLINDVYREFSVPVHLVPIMSVEERVEHILRLSTA